MDPSCYITEFCSTTSEHTSVTMTAPPVRRSYSMLVMQVMSLLLHRIVHWSHRECQQHLLNGYLVCMYVLHWHICLDKDLMQGTTQNRMYYKLKDAHFL